MGVSSYLKDQKLEEAETLPINITISNKNFLLKPVGFHKVILFRQQMLILTYFLMLSVGTKPQNLPVLGLFISHRITSNTICSVMV